jgi:hypothetical protein
VYPSVASFFTHEATFGGCELAAFPTDRFNHLFNGGFASTTHWTARAIDERGHDVSGSVTVEKEFVDARDGTTSLRITAPDKVAINYQQFVTLPRQPEAYQVTGAVLVKTTLRDRVRLYLNEPSRQELFTYSDYHLGDSQWHLLTATLALPASVLDAPVFQFDVQISSGDPLEVMLDAAVMYDTPLREMDGHFQMARDENHDISQVASAAESTPKRVEPYQCHAAWNKGYTRNSDVRPAYYVMFRSMYTGFTLCREKDCLDRLEGYLSTRYQKVFKNELVTIFSLQEATPASAKSSRITHKDPGGPLTPSL